MLVDKNILWTDQKVRWSRAGTSFSNKAEESGGEELRGDVMTFWTLQDGLQIERILT